MNDVILESELRRFEGFFTGIAPQQFVVKKLAEHVFQLGPKAGGVRPKAKQLALTIMGLTHGNEFAGIAVINDVLEFLAGCPSLVNMQIAFALGNPWASQQNRRFLESDLNRSFGRLAPVNHEEKRAKVLGDILRESAFFLDLHQTTEPCETPFFIFPYTEESYQFARAVEQRLPIVTHWGDSFSSEGSCSDEFTIASGGVGITLELGQNGFGAYHVAAGFKSVLQSIVAASAAISGQARPVVTEEPEIFTWAKIYPYPEGSGKLDEGWYNFKQVHKGQRLGLIEGKELLADSDGRVLFPKYVRGPEPKKPTELIRIMRRIHAKDLGT